MIELFEAFLLGIVLGWLIFRRKREVKPIQSESSTDIEQLSRALAHEIRNPLNTIQMNLQLLMEELKADERNAKRLSRMADELKRLDVILKSFLDFTRLPTPKFEKIQLNEFIGNVISIFRPGSKGILIETSLASGIPAIRADRTLLTEVIHNLLQNAIDTSPEGGKIIAETGKSEFGVYFAIADQGKGIPPELIDKIFQPYFSTKNSGIGIGMAVVKRIVEAHGGRIWIQSRIGSGTRVVVELPIR